MLKSVFRREGRPPVYDLPGRDWLLVQSGPQKLRLEED